MNIKILSREFLNEINLFLTKGEWPQMWDKYKDKSKPNSEREYIIIALGLLPKFNNKYSINRDIELNRFLKYHDNACDFDSFSIRKLNLSYLNDPMEGKWFDQYSSNWLGETTPTSRETLENFITSYSVLATFTTTTLRNHRYMTSNYSRSKKKAISYNGEEVIANFDDIYSRKNKPIRGFVRYDENGKGDMIKFIYKFASPHSNAFNFLLMIAATYIKGGCMAEEAEYRFLVISKNKIDNININCINKECLRFNCQVHDENYFYKGSCKDCNSIDPEEKRCEYINCHN